MNTLEELKLNPNDYDTYVDSDDIANALIDIAKIDGEAKDNLIDAIGWLEATAENPYNHDYFRVLYNTLARIAERH